MLRIISLFLLLIISRVSFAETIPATKNTVSGYTISAYNLIDQSYSNLCQVAFGSFSSFFPQFSAISIYSSSSSSCTVLYKDSQNRQSFYNFMITTSNVYQYFCPSGYTLSDSAGNPDSSGHYCTKNSCQDLFETTSMIDIPPRQTVTNACFNGCSATSMLGTWVCDSDTACSVRVQFDGNSCSGGVDYAANASSSSSGSDSDSPPPCSGGSTTGTVNGETVTTCADDGTDSPPITDTPSSATPTTTSGAGSTVGTPENTSGTQNSTVGGGSGSLGGAGYGEGGSTGSSGGTDSGGTSGSGTSGSGTGTDSGGTSGSGTDSGSTSGSGTGTDSGSTSGSGTGTDSGSTSGSGTGTDSGSTSGSGTGTDSGGTSGSGTGTDSGGTSGSGTGSGSGSGGGADSGTGTAASGAGDTDSDTPAEEEESGDGGGTFAAPGEGTDYLKDVFGESDLASLATDNAELTTKINQKMADVKAIFNLSTLSVSGDIPENQQEIKGASVDLSGRNIFEQLSIVAAAFYLCAIATAIYIVMGGKK
jgi:hypothetical protein